MSALDDLAALLHQTDCCCGEPPMQVDYRMAEAIIAAGWQPPRPTPGPLAYPHEGDQE